MTFCSGRSRRNIVAIVALLLASTFNSVAQARESFHFIQKETGSKQKLQIAQARQMGAPRVQVPRAAQPSFRAPAAAGSAFRPAIRPNVRPIVRPIVRPNVSPNISPSVRPAARVAPTRPLRWERSGRPIIGSYYGYRVRRPGYVYYYGWWFPAAAFLTGVIVGGAVADAPAAMQLSEDHIRWCQNRYRSYRVWDNSFQPYRGPRLQCVSPYGP